MFTIEAIRQRLGGSEALQRVLGLQAVIVKRTDRAVAARVTSPFGSETFEVMVSIDLAGRCSCHLASTGVLCDHVAAAALEWILDGDGREPVRYEPVDSKRFG